MNHKLREMKDYLNDRVHDPAIQSGIREIVRFASQGKRLTEAQQSVDSLINYLYGAMGSDKKDKLISLFHENNLLTYEDINKEFMEMFKLE